MSDPKGSPITEEMLVDFLIDHKIESAEELGDFSLMIHLIRAEPNRIMATSWDEEVWVH